MKRVLDAERLVERRKLTGMNKLQTANKMGLSQSGYVRYESGQRNPTVQVIEVMALELGTSVEYLVGETDDPAPNEVVIKKEREPELFALIEQFHTGTEEFREHLLSYAKFLQKDS